MEPGVPKCILHDGTPNHMKQELQPDKKRDLFQIRYLTRPDVIEIGVGEVELYFGLPSCEGSE